MEWSPPITIGTFKALNVSIVYVGCDPSFGPESVHEILAENKASWQAYEVSSQAYAASPSYSGCVFAPVI